MSSVWEWVTAVSAELRCSRRDLDWLPAASTPPLLMLICSRLFLKHQLIDSFCKQHGKTAKTSLVSVVGGEDGHCSSTLFLQRASSVFRESCALFSSLLQVLSDYFLLLTECLNSHCHTHNLSLSLSVCCHRITLSSPLPWVGFTFSKRIILRCCVGAHQQEGGERKTKSHTGQDDEAGQRQSERGRGTRDECSRIKPDRHQGRERREIMAEARNQVRWRTPETVQPPRTPHTLLN